MPNRPHTIPNTACLSSTYLGPISYYAQLYKYGSVLLEQHEHYVKQSFRNRCEIATPERKTVLTIPIVRPEGKCSMRDIRISDHDHWRHTHWNALVSAYENSPYFEYYADDFRPFYERKINYLFDFNEELRLLVCDLMGLSVSIKPTANYQPTYNTEEVDDFRLSIHPKISWECIPDFRPYPYYQVFAQTNGFLPNLSIVDLLFNLGPESLLVLRNSIIS